MSEEQLPKEPRSPGKVGLEEMMIKGSQRLTNLIGLKLLAVIEVGRSEENGWIMKLEYVEREGIPNTMDLIGLYEAGFDQYGHLLNYTRLDMRKRGESYT